MKKLSILFVLLTLVLTACSAPAEEPVAEVAQITVLTSPDYPPYESIDATGNYVGFDIELMEAIAEIMGVEVVWKEQSFDGIIAGLFKRIKVTPGSKLSLQLHHHRHRYRHSQSLQPGCYVRIGCCQWTAVG